jgi:hypothetical protein
MLIYLVALLLAAHVFVEAQTGLGSIKGVVIDEEGKPVSDRSKHVLFWLGTSPST